MRRTLLTLIAVILAVIVTLVCTSFVSPIDVFGGKERVVGKRELPDGERIEIVQYWNSGDFYNLELRHITNNQETYECLIDPDCLRLSTCKISIDPITCEATIAGRHGILVRYRWVARQLVRKNGVLVQATLLQ